MNILMYMGSAADITSTNAITLSTSFKESISFLVSIRKTLKNRWLKWCKWAS